MTPEDEVDMLRREYLESEDAEFFKDDLAFAVAGRIVKYEDPELLKQFPSWVGERVREMYRQHGSYGIISNLGEVDHSEMVSKLVKLLEPDRT
ncbi:hypothetical protein ACSFBF_32825 [Variovorax sp. ZT5P49]|uniref:hypothetical protein n=1 Tax=Variovorax sp. ZT5P49 TaxID=3443733 RepID=UPI003F45F37C